MSLIDDFRSECVRMVQTTEKDGAGGSKTTWNEGATFYLAIVEKTQTEPENGEKKRAKSFYEVYAERDTDLRYHDVFRRVSDGRVFRVTSNPNDKRTPARASFAFSVLTAEEWRLPK